MGGLVKAPTLSAKVLLVDDDPLFLDALKPKLLESFETVEQADDEDGAWKLLEANSYDIVLLDVIFGHRPAGLELCRRIKRDPRWRDVPVLIVSMADVMYGMNLKGFLDDQGCLPADAFIDKLAGADEIVKRARCIIERPAAAG